MCSWNWEKLKFIRSFNFTLKKSLLIFNINIRNKSKYLVFTSWLISQEVCIHIQYFFGVARNKLANTKYLELIKRRSKVQENNMSCERALNFDQWKTFSKNYKPMRVWLWLVYKFTENYCRLRLFSEFIQTQKRYPTSLGKIRILTWKLLVISRYDFSCELNS